MNNNISEKYAGRLVELIENDSDCIHLYQNIADNKLIVVGGGLPITVDSLYSLRESGAV